MTSIRLPALDGVRGIAITLVLLFHCFSIGSSALGSGMLTASFDGMWLGVDLFFVLSGYLITSILVREKSRSTNFLRDFYIRRSLRIFPAYYLVLVLMFTVFPLLSVSLPDSGLQDDAPYLALYLQNVIMSVRGEQMAWAGANHFWSLAVEEQFYLFWPVLVMLTPQRHLPWLCAAVFSAALASKLIFLGMDRSVWTPYTFPLSRADALVAGAFVSVLPANDSKASLRAWRLLLAGSLAVFCAAALVNHGLALKTAIVAPATSTAAIIFACLVKAIHQNRLWSPASLLLSRPALTWLGRYSYGIYLLHWPIFICAMEWCSLHLAPRSPEFFQAMLGAGVASVAISLVLAWAMYHAVEAPCLKLADRFRSARNGTPEPAPARLAAATN